MKNLKLTWEVASFALLFALPLGMWFLVLKPRRTADAAMLADIRQGYDTLQRVDQSQGAAVAAVRQETAGIESALASAEGRLSREEDTDRLLQDIGRMATLAGLRTKKIEIRGGLASRNPSDPGELRVAAALEGTFPAFVEFLQSVESYPKLLRVVKIKEQSSTDSSARWDETTVTLELQVFLARPKEAPHG